MNLKSVILRLYTVGYDTFQDARKRFMNQIRDIIRKLDMGIAFDEVEEKKETREFDTKYGDNKLKTVAAKLVEEKKLLPEEAEYINLIFDELLPLVKPLEKEYLKVMSKIVKKEPIFIEFLDKIRGIDKTLSSKLVGKLGDCHKFDTVSRLWAYCGQSVINNKAPERRKGESIHYSPRMRSLTWVISDCLMKANKGYYREIYDTEKEKQLQREYPVGELHEKYPKKKKNGKYLYESTDITISKGHAHNRALRKMRKIFLDHYWHASRELAGLEAKKNYVEGVLLHNHIITWRDAVKRENGGE